jgi:hypothetical protein
MQKLSPMSVQLLRENAQLYLDRTDSCAMMPMLPKRIIALCDTALELYKEQADARAHADKDRVT